MKTSIALKTLLGAGALALPLMAFAESNVQTGTATASPGATAHVDFSIVIPKILYLRVGAGSTYTSGTLTSANAIDLITFSPAAGTVGNGTAVAGTGGDLTGGVETAAIVSNSGNVTLNATASGALSNGSGDTIPFTQITTAATTGGFQPMSTTSTSHAYAIPIDTALEVARQIESRTASANIHIGPHGLLGVDVQDTNGSGALVAAVQSNSAAAHAGLVAGDLIVSINGQAISATSGLDHAMASTHVGDQIAVAWQDTNGQTHHATVTLSTGS